MSDQTTFLDDLKPVSASELMGGGGVISAVRTIDDPDPCATAGCAMQGDPLETCRDHRCPHRWRREEGRGDSVANTCEVTSKWNTPGPGSEDRKG